MTGAVRYGPPPTESTGAPPLSEAGPLREGTAVRGDMIGAVSALTHAATELVFKTTSADTRVFPREELVARLKGEHRVSIALTRQLVRDHRQRLAPDSSRHSPVSFQCNDDLANAMTAGLSQEVFDYLTEGLVPDWRVHGSVLCRRGDFSDRVWLLKWGEAHLFRDRPEPPLATLDWSISQLTGERIEILGPGQLVGFWAALLPLNDSAVGSDLDRDLGPIIAQRSPPQRDSDRLYDDLWIGGTSDRERGRNPQPHRYDVTAIVGEGNALVYELDREEFIHRLENRNQAMFEICREVARGVVLHAWRDDGLIDDHGALTPRARRADQGA